MSDEGPVTVWDRLRQFSETQSEPFTSQDAISWFRRHAHLQANERTIRTHVRGACWNVESRAQFTSREPFLTKLDRGLFRTATEHEIQQWKSASGFTPSAVGRPRKTEETSTPGFEWHSEEHTQLLLVRWLERHGWSIVKTAKTATRERGVDVVAERDGQRLGVEVKGFPSRFYVAGPNKGMLKPTRPEDQAKKWFAHALVPAMRLRTHEPDSLSVICFPDFPVYRALHRDTAGSLTAAGIDVWLVTEDGTVHVLD